jgi:predicted SnoaL-like aldol condensation-catalyzing enzyme
MKMPHGASQLFERLQKCVRDDDWDTFGEIFADAVGAQHGNSTAELELELAAEAEAEANEALVRRYFDMWNTGAGGVADAVLGPQYIDHAVPAVVGPAAVRSLAPRFHAAYPDAKMVIEEILVGGEFVSVRNAMHKTREGQPVVSRGMAFFRVADGKLVEQWSFYPGKPAPPQMRFKR